MGSVSSSASDLAPEVDEAGLRRLFFANREALEAGGIDLERALSIMGPAKAHLISKHSTVSREKIIKELGKVLPELAQPLVDIHGLQDPTGQAAAAILPRSAVKAAKQLREKELRRHQKAMKEYTDRDALLRLAENRTVRLLRPNFLMKWCANGMDAVGPLPQRLELERLEEMQTDPDDEQVFLDVDSMGREQRRSLEVVTLSCSRLGPGNGHGTHPDPDGVHLATADRLLRSFCFGSREASNVKDVDAWQRRGYRLGAGDGRPVGVFWDWCSIYQDTPEASLSPEHKAASEEALKNVAIWYANTSTVVWLLHYVPPHSMGGGGGGGYKDAGWRTMERKAAAIATRPGDLLDIDWEFRTLVVDKAFADEPKQFVTRKARSGEEKEVRDETTGQPKETEEYKAWRAVVKVTDSYFAGDYLQLCLDTRVQERSLAETPDAFNASLDEELRGDGGGAAIATTAAKGGADGGGQGGPLSLSSSSVAVAVECHPAVKANYHRAFKALVGQAPAISLPEHGLTDGGLRPFLAHVKGHGECPGLRTLDLRGNHRLTVALPEFGHALSGLSLLRALDLSGCGVSGNVADLSGLRRLELLRLSDNKFVYGRVGALSMLTDLKELGLRQCFKLEGDLAELAHLTRLEELDLGMCQKVSGDVGIAAHLPRLRAVSLTGRGVVGDLVAFGTCYHLERLDLNYTRVGGSLEALTSLQNLVDLRLQFTAVVGDLKHLAHLSHLRGLRLCGAKVSGDVRKLNPLECLELLDLNQCLKVKGSVRRLGVLNELVALRLGGTDVEGDVQDLNTLTNLRDLNLHKTKVAGGPRAVKRLLAALHKKQQKQQQLAESAAGAGGGSSGLLPRLQVL